MYSIVQPVTQKWLTNVAIVQHVVNGQRFEVACYSNKITAYRSGVEKDINEVLQARAVFSDAVKGELQSLDALQKAFGTHNIDIICGQIIQNGRVQYSELERTVEQERKFTEIAATVAIRLTNPVTGAAYPRSLIEAAMKNDLHYRITPQPASAQAAQVIRELEVFLGNKLPQKIQVSIELPLSHARECVTMCASQYEFVVDPETLLIEGQSCFCTATIDIQDYRAAHNLLKEITNGLAHVSIKGVSSMKLG